MHNITYLKKFTNNLISMRFFMNAKLKTLFSGIVAVSFAAIISFGCSNPSVGPLPVPTLPEGQTINLSNPSITAAVIVNSMKFGWNLGNTLDAHEGEEGEKWTSQKNGTESDWGMKDTATPALFKKLKASGIKTVRIPVSWHNHVDSNLDINSEWMSHVKSVVDMAYGEGLFVIINIHHDNYKGADLGTKAGFTLYETDKTQSLKFVEKIWKQVANTFKDYDGHLIFETLNEPRVIGDSHEWSCPNSFTCDSCKPYVAVINELNQKAVDVIRASGGNNANRIIMFPGYVASPYGAIEGKKAGVFKIPTDSATNRLALSVHMYTPYNFAMEYPGSSTLEQKHKDDLAGHFTSLNTTFISQGIPVVIGEMGATNKDNFEARKEWFTYYLGLCKTYNVAAVLWDNGNEKNTENGSESFGYMDRKASGGPAWFTDSKAAELIAAAVEARGTSDNGGSSSGNSKTIWTGTKDLKHWNGEDVITLDSSNFSTATDSTKIRFTISIGADCTAIDNGSPCTNNYSTIHPITAWPDENNDGNITFPEANTNHQLSVSPTASASTVTISPDSTSWATIKSKGLIIYGHKVVITKIELL